MTDAEIIRWLLKNKAVYMGHYVPAEGPKLLTGACECCAGVPGTEWFEHLEPVPEAVSKRVKELME